MQVWTGEKSTGKVGDADIVALPITALYKFVAKSDERMSYSVYL
jgi:hypothetical protein